MNIQDVQQLVDEGVTEISINAQSLADARPRAGRFLVRIAVLTNFLKEIEEELPKYQTLVNAQYAQAINSAIGKGITEKKVEAEANPVYSEAVENKAKLDALRDWVKNYIKIFDHAHLMYRQYSRAE